MADLLSTSVKRIIVETEWLPPIVINDPLGPPPPDGSASSRMGKLLKPRITVETAFGPVVSKPWGSPQPNWPLLKAIIFGLGGLTVAAIVVTAARRKKRPVQPKLAGFTPRRRRRRR